MPDLQYAQVVGRFGITRGDGADGDEYPDTVYCDEGVVVFTPQISTVKVIPEIGAPITLVNKPIVAYIGTDGWVTYDGDPHVWLVDLGIEGTTNPHVPRTEAAYSVQFQNVKCEGEAVSLPSFGFNPVAGEVNDLTLMAPLATGPGGQALLLGPQGVGIADAEVDGAGHLLLTKTDAVVVDAGPLPVGPGGSDAGVAGYVSTPGTASRTAVADAVADIDADDASAFRVQQDLRLSNTIAAQVTPLAETAAADYLATEPGVAAAAAAAVDTALAAENIYSEDLYSIAATSGVIIVTPDDGGTQTLALTGAARITLEAGAQAGATLALAITQGTGAPHAVTWAPNIAWQTTPTLSTTAGLTDVVTLICLDGYSWLGFVSGVGLEAPERILVDTFTRANAATLGHTETGEPWTSTNWSILSNQAKPTAAGITSRAHFDAGAATGIKVSCKPTQHVQTLRMEARASLDDATYYRLIWNTLSGTDAFIQRQNGSGQTVIGTTFALGFAAGATGRVSLEVVVDAGVATLKVYRRPVGATSDTEVYSTTDASPPPADRRVAMINMDANLYPVDDFRVEFL